MRKEYDFSKARKAVDVPHLARLQAGLKGKTRITIMLDNDVLEEFRHRANEVGLGYQTLINQTLRSHINARPLDEQTIRKVIREEISSIK